MLKEYFYMFILYTDMGKKLKDILNSLFPGLIREPQRVRVPVQGQDERNMNRRQQKTQNAAAYAAACAVQNYMS